MWSKRMATPRTRVRQEFHSPPHGTRREVFRTQYGWNGDRKTAYPYDSVFEKAYGRITYPATGTTRVYDAGTSPGAFIVPASDAQFVYNKAYARFQGKVRGDVAQLGASIGEYPSSSRMVKDRAEGIYTFTRNLRHRWAKLPSRKKRKYRAFADYWLEYSFGWAPLFGDLWNAYKRLCAPILDFSRVRAGAATTFDYYQNLSGNPKTTGTYTYKVLIFGRVRMTNPNTSLLSDLGLLNPAAIAWELVPYSFVADWMFDIGGCIGSWSDSFGYEFENTGVNRIQFGSRSQTWDSGFGVIRCSSVVSKRTIGIPMPLPNLAILKNIGSNLKRALNALALTAQVIDRGVPPPRRKRPKYWWR